MAGDSPPRGHHPGTSLFGHRGSSGRSLLRTLTSLAKKRTKLPPSAPKPADPAEFVPGTAAVSSLTPDTYEARGLHEKQATQLPSTTPEADTPDPEAPLTVHVAIRFPGRRPCPLPTYTHTYSSSRSLDPTDRLCHGLIQRLEHCSNEFITRKDSAALDPQKPPPAHQRSTKPLRYSIRFRVVRRDTGIWAERTYRSYQAHELTSQDARDLILATHRMVALFLSRNDPSFSWTDLPAADEVQFAAALGLPPSPPLPERVCPVVGEPLPLVCVPKLSPTDPESPPGAPVPGYSISFAFRSHCPSRSRRHWKRLVYLQSNQGTPLTLALAEDLFGQTSTAITSALATRQAALLQEHKACDALDGVPTTCQHFDEDAVDIDLRIENNLGPEYGHLQRSIRSKLLLFRHPDGLDCRQFLHDVRSRLVHARDAADDGLTNLPDLDLRIVTLCGPGWSVDNPARFVLDAGTATYTRQTIEAILDRVLTGIANVVGGRTYTLQLAAYKRGHLILDKILIGRASPANPWLRPPSAGEQTESLVARLRDRIQEDIAAVCKDTCLLDGIAEGTSRAAEITELAAATPDASLDSSESASESVSLPASPAAESIMAGGAAVETDIISTPAAPRVVDLPDDVFFDALESRPSSSSTTSSIRRRAFPLLPEKFTLPHARSISVGTVNTTGTAKTFETVTTSTSISSQSDACVDGLAASPSKAPTAEPPALKASAPSSPAPDSVPLGPASEALPSIEPILEQQETPSTPLHNNDPIAPLSPVSDDAQDDSFAADTTALTALSSTASRPSTPCHSVRSGTYDSPNSSFLDDEITTQRKGDHLEGDASSPSREPHSLPDVDTQDFAPVPASTVDSKDNFKVSAPSSRAPVCFSLVPDESDLESEDEAGRDANPLDNASPSEPEVSKDIAMAKPAIDVEENDTALAPDAATETATPAVAEKDGQDQSSGSALQSTHAVEDQTASFGSFSQSAAAEDADDIGLIFPDYGTLDLKSRSIASAEFDKQQPSKGSPPDIETVPEMRLNETHDAAAEEDKPCAPLAVESDERPPATDAEGASVSLDKGLPLKLQGEPDAPLSNEIAHDKVDNFDKSAEPPSAGVQCEGIPTPSSDNTSNTLPESPENQEPDIPKIDMASVQPAPDVLVPEVATEAVPEVASELSPEVTPEAAIEVIPEVVPEVAHEIVPVVQVPEIPLPSEISEGQSSQLPPSETSAEAKDIHAEAEVQVAVPDSVQAIDLPSPRHSRAKTVRFAAVDPEPFAPVSEAPLAKDHGKALGWDHGGAVGKELVRGSSAILGRLAVPERRATPLASAIRRGPLSLPTAGYLGLPKKNIPAFGLRGALTGSHAFDAIPVQSLASKIASKKGKQTTPSTTPPPREGAAPKQPTEDKSTRPTPDKSLVSELPPPTDNAVASSSAKASSGAPAVEQAGQDGTALPRLLFAFASLAVVSQVVHRSS